MDSTDCSWCRQLASLERCSNVVWEFPGSVVFLGPWQYYHGYCILVHRRHASELSQLEEAERAESLEEMCTLARAIEGAFRPHKLNYELLGNQVPHLHWHIFPRYLSDADRLRPVWFAIDAAERDDAQTKRLQSGPMDRHATAQLLRSHLEKQGTS